MHYRNFIILVLLFFALPLFSQKIELTGAYEKCYSFINIAGNTNINNFEFNMDLNDTTLITDNKIINVVNNNGREYYEISIPVKNFKTNNKQIYKDFLDLLKADKYPFVVIGIPYNQLNNILSGRHDIPEIKITIAGVTNIYEISGLIASCTSGSRYVNGKKTIKLTDFNLDPPEKIRGLIKVKDNVIINFGFVFLSQNNA